MLLSTRKRSLKIPDTLAACSAIILFITTLIEPSTATETELLAATPTDLEVLVTDSPAPVTAATTAEVETTRARPPLKLSQMLFRWP